MILIFELEMEVSGFMIRSIYGNYGIEFLNLIILEIIG